MAGFIIAKIQRLGLVRDSYLEAVFGHIDICAHEFTDSSFPAPSLMNTKGVRSTIQNAAEQRDHHRAARRPVNPFSNQARDHRPDD
ncbi:MAG: hypothetical protein P4L96_22095 [Rhodoferax sp.]|nr:hypothetical protein [Rhodoferax sp.]